MQKSPVLIVFGFGVLLLIAAFTFRQLRAARDASLPITPVGILEQFEERLQDLIDSSRR